MMNKPSAAPGYSSVDPDEVDPSSKKHRNKFNYCKKNIGELPLDVQKLYANGDTRRRTKLVNNLVKNIGTDEQAIWFFSPKIRSPRSISIGTKTSRPTGVPPASTTGVLLANGMALRRFW